MAAYIPGRGEPVDKDAPLSSRNVSRLTTYELRQELVRRDKLDIPDDRINHRTMLQRLMQLLLEDEKEAASTKETEEEMTRMEKINNAKAERERKKQEAIERSKARQQDPSYFDKKVESNVAPEKINLEGLEELNSESNEGNGEDGDDSNDSDPFSLNKKATRGKIHFNF